jgi:hypothetical protein
LQSKKIFNFKQIGSKNNENENYIDLRSSIVASRTSINGTDNRLLIFESNDENQFFTREVANNIFYKPITFRIVNETRLLNQSHRLEYQIISSEQLYNIRR